MLNLGLSTVIEVEASSLKIPNNQAVSTLDEVCRNFILEIVYICISRYVEQTILRFEK